MCVDEALSDLIVGPTGLEGILELSSELGMTELSSEPTAAYLRYLIRDKLAERERRRSPTAKAKGVVKRQRQLVSVSDHSRNF